MTDLVQQHAEIVDSITPEQRERIGEFLGDLLAASKADPGAPDAFEAVLLTVPKTQRDLETCAKISFCEGVKALLARWTREEEEQKTAALKAEAQTALSTIERGEAIKKQLAAFHLG
jgi:hypothetical protein